MQKINRNKCRGNSRLIVGNSIKINNNKYKITNRGKIN